MEKKPIQAYLVNFKYKLIKYFYDKGIYNILFIYQSFEEGSV